MTIYNVKGAVVDLIEADSPAAAIAKLKVALDAAGFEPYESDTFDAFESEPVLFTVDGTDRQVGAIGIFEPFTIEVWATSDESARDEARAARYRAGRDHVHITNVTL